jgi:hypothetical protein
VKATMEIRTKAVVFYEEGIRSAREIGGTYNVSERTMRRWAKAHSQDPENGLRAKKTKPKRSPRAISYSLEQRIIRLKEKYIPHGVPVVSSTSLIYRVPGGPFIEFSRNTVFLFKSKRNPNQPGNDSSIVMLTACGKEIHSSFVSVELARVTSLGLLMTAHAIE